MGGREGGRTVLGREGAGEGPWQWWASGGGVN